MRFVVDDAPWAPADISPTLLDDGLDALVDRIQAALVRRESVVFYVALFQQELVGKDDLNRILYDADNPRQLSRDVRLRLKLALDRIQTSFAEDELPELEAEVAGQSHLAPASVLAWAQVRAGHAVACLTPSSSGRSGPTPVRVGAATATVHFVSSEAHHVAFFRDAIVLERADEDGFARLAASAFPELCFVKDVWRGLRDLSRPFRDRRDDLIRHLGVLNDHGRKIFARKLVKQIESEFMGLKLTISQETKETLADATCRKARERFFAGEALIFDWHSKIELHLDRIHIHPGTAKSRQQVIVGIIHRHLPLPGD
jgi:hypothetical protein